METKGVLQPEVKPRELYAWAMYDFANSGYTTVVITTVFSAYFVGVVAQEYEWATLLLTLTLSVSYLLLMLSLPAMGARADRQGSKKWMLFFSTLLCVVTTACLAFSGPGYVVWAVVFLLLSNYGYGLGEALIASFLPEIAKRGALGRVSGWGWGFGYLGGLLTLSLAIAIVAFFDHQGLGPEYSVPWVMILTAVVFLVMALPALVFLRQRRRNTSHLPSSSFMLSQVWLSLTQCRRDHPNLFKLLLCGAWYHAGIAVVITLSSVYATQVMGFSMQQTMMLIFIVNIAAAISALAFGHVQDKIGHKSALALTLCGWIIMVAIAATTHTIAGFWLAATCAGLCIGSSQSAGRAMVGVLAPNDRLAEMYGLWAFALQFAAIVGPLAYGLITWLSAGNHRLALACTGVFFLMGLWRLRAVQFAPTNS